MHGSLVRGTRLVILVSVIGLGVGQYQAQARSVHSHQAPSSARQSQPTDVLLYQGKILPIVTDVYSSLNDLSTAVNDRSVDGIAKVGDQFAGEQQRFEAIKPIPKAIRHAASVLDLGLHNMNSGTKALVVGLRASDNASVQRAANQLQQGINQFQQAVNQVRSMAGPVGEPSALPGSGKGTPVPTPVIKGLP
jgi:hypothetical protein